MKELQARHDYPVAVLCSALGVSRSGYYAWCERPASARQRDDERLKVAIRGVHAASRQTYGTRRVLVELRAQGFEAGRDRVDRSVPVVGQRRWRTRREVPSVVALVAVPGS